MLDQALVKSVETLLKEDGPLKPVLALIPPMIQPIVNADTIVGLIMTPFKERKKELLQPIEKTIRDVVETPLTKMKQGSTQAEDQLVCVRFYYKSNRGTPSFLAMKSAEGKSAVGMVQPLFKQFMERGKTELRKKLQDNQNVKDIAALAVKHAKEKSEHCACIVEKCPAKIQPMVKCLFESKDKVLLFNCWKRMRNPAERAPQCQGLNILPCEESCSLHAPCLRGLPFVHERIIRPAIPLMTSERSLKGAFRETILRLSISSRNPSNKLSQKPLKRRL